MFDDTSGDGTNGLIFQTNGSSQSSFHYDHIQNAFVFGAPEQSFPGAWVTMPKVGSVRLYAMNGRTASETLTGSINIGSPSFPIFLTTYSAGHDLYTGTTRLGGISYSKSGFGGGATGGSVIIDNVTNGSVAINAGSAQRVTVTNAGLVGINDATPSLL